MDQGSHDGNLPMFAGMSKSSAQKISEHERSMPMADARESATVSMRNEEVTSQRSASNSSGGSSSERRLFKSNRVLQAKHENLLMRQGMTPEEAFQSYAAAGGHDTSVPADGGLSDAQAAEIFAKLQQQ